MTDEKKTIDGASTVASNTAYPEAAAVFTAEPKTLHDARDNSVVILDTNSLLVPYSIGRDSLAQIKKTYNALVAEKKLVIPGQVAREFAKHRATKLAELFSQLSRKKNAAPFAKGKYPLLESLTDYQESVKLEEEIDRLIEKYKRSIDKILHHIQTWTWNDPVSLLYRELFSKPLHHLFHRSNGTRRNCEGQQPRAGESVLSFHRIDREKWSRLTSHKFNGF